jgi:nucleoid-associated protein YgaU
MPLQERMKLQKLAIKAYRARSRLPGELIGTFEAMFNPETFSQTYVVEYGKNQGLNSSNRSANYSRSKPRELKLKLVLDGTGVQDIGIVSIGTLKPVSARVEQFIDLTFRMNGTIHEPNYLVAEWGGKEDGGLIFSCRLGSVSVAYTSFDRNGAPLLTKEVYGTSAYYLRVAQVNGLDDFRNLTPGQALIFPPLEG